MRFLEPPDIPKAVIQFTESSKTLNAYDKGRVHHVDVADIAIFVPTLPDYVSTYVPWVHNTYYVRCARRYLPYPIFFLTTLPGVG